MSDLKQRLAALEEAINNTSPYREPGRRAGLLAEADQIRHAIKLQDEPKDAAFHLASAIIEANVAHNLFKLSAFLRSMTAPVTHTVRRERDGGYACSCGRAWDYDEGVSCPGAL